ncbi:hypothetical protein Hanom_Chr06g00484301 [Helianthus anomalus]
MWYVCFCSHFSTFCIDVIFDLNITPSSSLPHDNFFIFFHSRVLILHDMY